MMLNEHVDKKLSTTSARILAYIYENETITEVYQRDLERYICLKRSSISMSLTAMEKRGLITRESVMSDARLNRLRLTPYARTLVPTMRKIYLDNDEEMLANLSPEERVTLKALLEKVEHTQE